MLGVGACAGRPGWQRIEPTACGEAEAPRLCLLAGPDAAQVLRVGGAQIVPGECAQARRARGGRVEVQVRDGRDGRERARKIRVRRGETAMLSAVDGEIVVHERRACLRGS